MVKVERDKCVGLGMCEAAAPDAFEVGEDGLVIFHEDALATTPESDVEQAVHSCPMAALSLVRQ